jgi:predicted regulator of Ras-like GTPase activity (Roadblock/LC7/MglB family)
MAEPFKQMLTDLVTRVDGAVGAAFIDSYGEAVQTYAVNGDVDYVNLMGAYQGIAFQTARNISTQLEAGRIDYTYTSYDTVSFLVKALPQDYFVLLLLGPEANVGQGIYNVRRAAADFAKEI